MRGNLVYAYAAIRALIASPGQGYAAGAGWCGGDATRHWVAVGKIRALRGMFIARTQSFDDGKLDVITVSDVSKLRYAKRQR